MGNWDLVWPTLIRQNNIMLKSLPASEVENMYTVCVCHLYINVTAKALLTQHF